MLLRRVSDVNQMVSRSETRATHVLETYYGMFLYPMPKPSFPAVSPHSLEASADSLPPGLAETATIQLPVKRVDSSVLEIRFDA